MHLAGTTFLVLGAALIARVLACSVRGCKAATVRKVFAECNSPLIQGHGNRFGLASR